MSTIQDTVASLKTAIAATDAAVSSWQPRVKAVPKQAPQRRNQANDVVNTINKTAQFVSSLSNPVSAIAKAAEVLTSGNVTEWSTFKAAADVVLSQREPSFADVTKVLQDFAAVREVLRAKGIEVPPVSVPIPEPEKGSAHWPYYVAAALAVLLLGGVLLATQGTAT